MRELGVSLWQRPRHGEELVRSLLDSTALIADSTSSLRYTNNLRISIPVTIVVGIIVLLILWALIRCCCCGGRKKQPKYKASSAAYATPAPMAYPNQYPPQNGNGYYPPPPPSHQSSVLRRNDAAQYGQPNGQNGGWVDPSTYNGNYGGQGQYR